MSKRYFPGEDCDVMDDRPATLAKEWAPYSEAPSLSEMSFPERRTVLLIHACLLSSGCDGATTWMVHEYLSDAGVIPLLTKLRLHCAFTFSHSLKVMKLVLGVTRQAGVDGSEHAILCVGALLHDIGKLSLPISLLRAPRALRKAEIERIRTHSEAGYDAVSDKRILGWNSVLDIIRHHHEFLDGSGYPFGLTASQISWRTRCVTVCDVFSALTEDRPYRPAMSQDKAFSILAEMDEAGKLDGEIVATLRSSSIVGIGE